MRNAVPSPGTIQQEFSQSSANAFSRPRQTASPRITLRLTEEENAKLRQLCEDMTVSAISPA
jgi:hypothetical protein